jgi:hypothetical protein
MDFPLIEDPTIEITSTFGSFNETFPKIGEFLSAGTLLSASVGGDVGAGLLHTRNLFDIPRWQKTEPVKFVAKLVFELKTDPYVDIFEPMTRLMNYTILTLEEGKYKVPGISLASIGAFQNQGGESSLSENSKLLTIGIPGVIYLSVAILERAIPNYSKEITESGYPLWGQLDLNVMGVFPANSDMFEDARMLANSYSSPAFGI